MDQSSFDIYTSKAQETWNKIHRSFLFIPGIIIGAAIILAFLLIYLDSVIPLDFRKNTPLLFTVTPAGARSLLTTIATSLMTAMSVTFPMTVVAVQLSSSQYSSRILRTFVEDKVVQFVLGSLVAVFIYSLLVVRSIRVPDSPTDAGSVPEVAVMFAAFFALFNAILIIYYIRHIIKKLQVSEIIYEIHKNLSKQIDNIYPEKIGKEAAIPQSPEEILKKIKKDNTVCYVRSDSAGFVTTVNEQSLQHVPTEGIQWIYITPRIGDFIFKGQVIAKVDRAFDGNDTLEKTLRGAVQLERQRSMHLDPLFAIRQLEDLALKTLSQGDPTTAEYCVQYMGNALIQLAQREFPNSKRTFKNKDTIFLFNRISWEEFVEGSFQQILQHAASSPHVITVLLQVLHELALFVPKSRLAPIVSLLSDTRELIKTKIQDKKTKESFLQEIASIESIIKQKK